MPRLTFLPPAGTAPLLGDQSKLFTGTYDLSEIFKRLGVTDVFSDHGDLSGITGKPKQKVSKASSLINTRNGQLSVLEDTVTENKSKTEESHHLLVFVTSALCVHCHQVPHYEEDQDSQKEISSPQQQSQAEGSATGKNMACHKIAPSNADFAFRFYRQAASQEDGKNVCFSPVSISTAFAMLMLGAKNTTLRQTLEAFAFNLTEIEEKEIHDGFRHLLHMLNQPDSGVQLSMGNALFIKDGLNVLPKFLEDVKSFYASEAFLSNFQNPPKAEKQINDYIEKKTAGKIASLVKDLDPDVLMVLVNYIFFKANWKSPFKKEDTKEDDFFVNSKTPVKVKMMHGEKVCGVYRDDILSYWVVEMPYKGNAAALFILPDEGKMKQVEEALLKETVEKWEQALEQRQIHLYLPKFSISGTYEMTALLKNMGVMDVFSDCADLSGVTGRADLKVSKALHKAVVDVDEKGTEAAAATALLLVFGSCFSYVPPPIIKFNKPFLMVIVEKNTHSILFVGKIVDPTSA
ncbi:alpha-1-antitrypsin-like [Alligator mississippiensis]|uniref:Alpha-1-antitrypsin-like n=1 Tax=Alligator mississippiensis TaxID=8496 RepID=A0A151P8Q8_ALLMI|nr:alpha-1-antitrypsin-like [Alligator mississippiensis]